MSKKIISGKIDNVIYRNSSSGRTILVVNREDGKTCRIIGNILRDVETGLKITAEGECGTGSSRAREFHPHPLTEPCVKVSPHTALHIQRFVHRHNLSQMVLLLSSYPPLCLRVV